MKQGVAIDASIRIINQSGRDIHLFWINSQDKSQIPMSEAPLEARDDPHYFSTSVYHQFLLKEACDEEEEQCQLHYFRVTAKEIGK